MPGGHSDEDDILPAAATVEVIACVFNALYLGASGGLALNRAGTRGLLPAWAGAALLLACADPIVRLYGSLREDTAAASLQLPSGLFELLALCAAVTRCSARWGEPALPTPLAGRAEAADGQLPVERGVLRAWLVSLSLVALARVGVLALSAARVDDGASAESPAAAAVRVLTAIAVCAACARACGADAWWQRRARRRAAVLGAAQLLDAVADGGADDNAGASL
jgi:hypothetical protein